MSNPDIKERLFEAFPPVKPEEWKERIVADLKGADYEKKLVWKTREGFTVQPFYTAVDLPSGGAVGLLPDVFPYRRGNRLANDWHIRQDIRVDDIRMANRHALDVLMKGVTSLGFILGDRPGPRLEEIELLCENIYADAVELNFSMEGVPLPLVSHIEKLAVKYNRKFEDIHGSVDFDPLGSYVLKGKFPKSAGDSFDQARELIQAARHLPNFRVITVHGDHFHNSGSTLVQELAFSLAQGVNYLTQLTERELSINQVAPRIKFQFAIGSDYFMEIAKIRAARQLWAHIVKAYGPCHDSKARMYVHSVTSSWNKTVYDPYVNMLRTTTEAMAGITGGADSLTIAPFNEAYEGPTPFSERIARNQQLLLKEESYMDKVADPAAGSYYLENLTDSIARESWKLFMEVQERGGFLEAFRAGFIQQAVNGSAAQRDMNIATRHEILLGTNQYPNSGEVIERDLPDAVFHETDLTAGDAEVETLKPYRGAQAFERLRYRTDRHARSAGRPKVFLLTMGNLAMRRARAQFSGNFFGCAGFEVIDNNGFATTREAADAVRKSGAQIAVLCSSDEEYASLAPELHGLIGGEVQFVVAGYPKEILDSLKKSGIRHFIHLRSNVLQTLQEFQKLLGIEGEGR